MQRRLIALVVIALAGVLAGDADVQTAAQQLQRWYYYPYHYFPHNYWPATSPQWPEAQGMPYRRPPAYMAYPAFREPNWRYELWSPQRYYRGHHFWLDSF